MGLHTSRHTGKNSGFSTQDEHLVLLGLEALTDASHFRSATRSSYVGQSPAVKQQIVDMAMNASGIRDTARVARQPYHGHQRIKKRHLT